jgi:hypothetical protein
MTRPRGGLGLILGAVALALGVVALALMLAWHGSADGRLGQLQTQLTQARQADARMSAQLARLGGQVAGLTVPTDPLSAYNQICNQAMTNNQTGQDQVYYWPCTNNAQTIPQPGN